MKLARVWNITTKEISYVRVSEICSEQLPHTQIFCMYPVKNERRKLIPKYTFLLVDYTEE